MSGDFVSLSQNDQFYWYKKKKTFLKIFQEAIDNQNSKQL